MKARKEGGKKGKLPSDGFLSTSNSKKKEGKGGKKRDKCRKLKTVKLRDPLRNAQGKSEGREDR